MIYYKDTNNQPFAFEDAATKEVIDRVEATHNTTLTKITKTEYENIIAPAFKEIQTQRLSYIKQSFNASLSQGYTCSNGVIMDADMSSISMLNSGYTLAVSAGATTMDIRDYNNVVHNVVAIADVKQMLLELGANFQAQLAKKWQLEEQVNAATTQAQLDAIVW
jgi:hypothetical protein